MSPPTVQETSYPAIKNAPLIGLAEGSGTFNIYHIAGGVVVVPYIAQHVVLVRGGFGTYVVLLVLGAIPIVCGYCALVSRYGERRNGKVRLPGKNVGEYVTFTDPVLRARYARAGKVP